MNDATRQSRYWCWTLNNYTGAELAELAELHTSEENVQYICWGREVGESGTPHLQGYLELARKRRLSSVKTLAGLGRVHLETRRGSQEQAITYCKKDGQFVEHGTLGVSRRGKRNDLVAIRDAIDSGAPESKVAEDYFGSWCRYRKSFSAYRSLKRAKKVRDTKVVVLSGPPGVGKTRLIFEHEESLFICPDETLKWFDGYNGEDAILIDDYRGDGNPSFLLRLLDRYPVLLPIKGSYVPLLATKIYITSNQEPPWNHPNPSALNRRIHAKIKMAAPIDFDDPACVTLWTNMFN